MEKIIIGNWKMHGSRESARALAQAVVAKGKAAVICPPAPFLQEVGKIVAGTSVQLGAQDCHWEREGAFTGDISALMLKEAGCSHVIAGHSERRQGHGERSCIVQAKARRAMAEGLVPIICVGETLEERERGDAMKIVDVQLRESIPEGADKAQLLLAYEPVWAIGTGHTPTTADITAMHRHIAEVTKGAKVLYGGSVKASNAAEILSIPEVAGVLVGGASLDAKEFGNIIDAANA